METTKRGRPLGIRPSNDVERVLGQIARGEISAGRTAARTIAGRHEAAYGDVWARPTDIWAAPAEVWADPDTAFADGVTDLTTRKDVRP
ncbi:hypothetical protein [Streptomyces sp. NPDC060194]|uniref:hypothetical protein n=1 Tax=Streptomyces sp. NPDC060194 TaxID=3347069 RepID=UPI003654AD97